MAFNDHVFFYFGIFTTVVFLIGSSSSESTENSNLPSATEMNEYRDSDVSATDLPITPPMNDSCVEEGIFGVVDNKRAFYKCVPTNTAVVFRKYSLECPTSTYFDIVSKNCQKEEPSTTETPFVVGSIFGMVKNTETGNCLKSSMKDHVFAGACGNSGNFELWDRFSDGRVKNAETRKCLEGDEDGHVFAASCNGKDAQRWTLDGVKRYVNLGSKRCLASNVVGYVHTGLCNDGVYKRWE